MMPQAAISIVVGLPGVLAQELVRRLEQEIVFCESQLGARLGEEEVSQRFGITVRPYGGLPDS